MKRLLPVLAISLLAAACSTTRVLEEGQYRLTRNEIAIEGGSPLKSSDVSSGIRQSAQGWNPFICVYNWSKKDGLWHKLGIAPTVYDPSEVEASAENIASRLGYLGYYNSTVTASEKPKGKKMHVKYSVHPGKRYIIDSLSFDIPPDGTFPADFNADTAAIRKAILGSYLSEDMLEKESVRSTSRLRNLGYFDLSKNNYSFEADTLQDGTASLVYRVRGYTRSETEAYDRPLSRYHIGKVEVTRPQSLQFSDKVLRGLTTLRPGQLYSEDNVNTTYARLSAVRAFSSVNIAMTPSDSSTVDCDITLQQSPQQGFKLNFESSTNSSGLFSISPKLSFFHKNIFHGGEWLNLGFSGEFQRRFSDGTSATEFGTSAGISIPRFLGLPYEAFPGPRIPRTEVNFAFNYQDRPEYNRLVGSTAFGYSANMGKVSYQIYPVQINYVRLFDLSDDFARTLQEYPFLAYSYQSHFDAGMGFTLYYNTNTDIVPKDSYLSHRLSMDLSGNVLSLFNSILPADQNGYYTIFGAPYAQYVRAEYSFARAWKYTEKQSVAVRFLAGAGYAYGNSDALPFEKQFYAGGASSMRGWQARSLGPGPELMNPAFSIPSQTGDVKLEANLEYRFNVIWKLEGALFTDVGNVWSLEDRGPDGGTFRFNDFYKSLAADWGLGVRVDLTFILLRIDFGMKLFIPSDSEESGRFNSPRNWLKGGNNAIHFGVGYPF
mgnify:CR=1 FL=1